MSKVTAPAAEPITKIFGMELNAEQIDQVSGAGITIKIEESEGWSLSFTAAAVEVTVERT